MAWISDIFDRICFHSVNMSVLMRYLLLSEKNVTLGVYTPNKPVKYGTKTVCLTKAHHSYFYNGYLLWKRL